MNRCAFDCRTTNARVCHRALNVRFAIGRRPVWCDIALQIDLRRKRQIPGAIPSIAYSQLALPFLPFLS